MQSTTTSLVVVELPVRYVMYAGTGGTVLAGDVGDVDVVSMRWMSGACMYWIQIQIQ